MKCEISQLALRQLDPKRVGEYLESKGWDYGGSSWMFGAGEAQNYSLSSADGRELLCAVKVPPSNKFPWAMEPVVCRVAMAEGRPQLDVFRDMGGDPAETGVDA